MPESGSEELKKKFREVLEQKNSKSHNSVEHKDGGPKVNNATVRPTIRRCSAARASETLAAKRQHPLDPRIERVLTVVAPTGFEPALPP